MAISTTDSNQSNLAEIPSQTVTNTMLGGLIYDACATDQKITIPANQTLNESFEHLTSQSIGERRGRDFNLGYFGIGRGGAAANGVDSEGVTVLVPNQHQPDDANLFNILPFACRTIDNDLTEAERADYRFRIVKNVGGVEYAFYYLKKIDFSSYQARMLKTFLEESESNGKIVIKESTTDYVPDESCLHPTPIELTSENTTPTSNTYLNGTAILDCTLSSLDLEELKNVCRVLYNDASKASINEVMICWGIETIAEGNISGGIVTYNELISVVPAHFITEKDSRNANANNSIQLVFDHGVSEPKLLHTIA